ncbi:MAG: hypothetical protein KF911_05805 [Pseudomonadales bacterium]|nr:hypothetical protein [Pseudomonadales bacterium]
MPARAGRLRLPRRTRLEVNHVPGKGNLAETVRLPLPEAMQVKLSEP